MRKHNFLKIKDALEFVVPFLLRYSGDITTEQSIAQSVVNLIRNTSSMN